MHYVAISTQRVLVGFAFGAAIGLALGAIVSLSKLANILLAPTFGGIRAVPSLAWVPLLMDTPLRWPQTSPMKPTPRR